MLREEHYQQSLIIIRHIQYIVWSCWLLQCNEELPVKGKALVMWAGIQQNGLGDKRSSIPK